MHYILAIPIIKKTVFFSYIKKLYPQKPLNRPTYLIHRMNNYLNIPKIDLYKCNKKITKQKSNLIHNICKI